MCLVMDDAVHRTALDALCLIEVANAFGASGGVDHIDIVSLGNSLLGHSGTHTSQLMHSSVIIKAMVFS